MSDQTFLSVAHTANNKQKGTIYWLPYWVEVKMHCCWHFWWKHMNFSDVCLTKRWVGSPNISVWSVSCLCSGDFVEEITQTSHTHCFSNRVQLEMADNNPHIWYLKLCLHHMVMPINSSHAKSLTSMSELCPWHHDLYIHITKEKSIQKAMFWPARAHRCTRQITH